jgi:hypothetical protein
VSVGRELAQYDVIRKFDLGDQMMFWMAIVG